MAQALADYVPKGASRELFFTLDREVLLVGPAGTGKTRGALERANQLAETYPGSRQLFVRKTLRSLRQSVLVTFETHVLGDGHPAIHGTASRETRANYVYPNGSEIVLGGLDKPEKTYSQEYDIVWVFEARECTLDAHEKLLRCLRWGRMPFQQIICDTNPAGRHHYLLRRAKRGQMAWLKSWHRDNPLMWDEERNDYSDFGSDYIKRTLGGITGKARRASLLEGRWESEEGAIWPEYDDSIHRIPRSALPELRYFVASKDFGFNDAGVLQVWGVDRDRRAYRVAEIYRKGVDIDQWAEWAAKLRAKLPYLAGIADSADAQGGVKLLNKRLGPAGSRDVPSVWRPAVKKGPKSGETYKYWALNEVRALLKPDAQDKPALYLVDDALEYAAELCGIPEARDPGLDGADKPCCTEEEIPGYTYLEPDETKPNRETPDPLKPNDGCDALEYFAIWHLGRHLDPGDPPKTFEPGTFGHLMPGHTGRKRRSA